ncbi:hypothetical protein SAY87_003566 [Trapa incisa]|uniref:Uncharacterized protein n=1 Tax=Trapa incisa TaxID=236973 RepID=A0AAN7QLB1_9MYRT|nr:hypothetical protein SAY87_003566 [Trapa incisa]
MGTSASTEQKDISPEQRELEGLAASTGAVPMLQKAFANLADPQENAIPIQSLQKCFSICYKRATREPPGAFLPDSILRFLGHLGLSIVDVFFVSNEGGLSWLEFVRGYLNCCGRMTASVCLTNLLRIFEVSAKRAGLAAELGFESDGTDCKVMGYLMPSDIYALLIMCWSMLWSTRTSSFSRSEGDSIFYVPEVENLLFSVVDSCAEGGGSSDFWNCDVFNLQAKVPAGKFMTWVLATIPRLPDCFSQFVSGSLQHLMASESVSILIMKFVFIFHASCLLFLTEEL